MSINNPVTLSQLGHSHMNRAQKRAFILRDELKFLDAHHLDTFLDGIGNPEPPNYQVINGKILPALTEVTLKEKATRLDLGNVRFSAGEKRIRRVHLSIEAGTCEMRESDALPEDDADLQSVPIEQYIAKNTIPLFLDKFKAIDTRKRALNETRRFAHNAVNQPNVRVNEGKTLAKLDGADHYGGSKETRKRASGEPVARHPSNKRKRVGLESIPDTTKSETFDSISEQVKIDLFNTIIKTAFPSFDNLMMASWNVVSVYLNVGSEDKVLHGAISELNTVLREFEACYGKAKSKTDTQQKGSREQVRSQNGHLGGALGGLAPGGPAHETARMPSNTVAHEPLDRSQARVLQMTQQSEEIPGEETRATQYNHTADLRHSNGRMTFEQQEQALRRKTEQLEKQIAAMRKASRAEGGSTSSSQRDSPGQNRNAYHHHRLTTGQGPRVHQEQSLFTSQKLGRGHGRPPKASLEANKQAYSDTDGLDDLFDDEEQDEVEEGEDETLPQDSKGQIPTQGVFLGSSTLGAPKPAGTAPVAPMMHTRKETGGSGGR